MIDLVSSFWSEAASQWRELSERVGFWQPSAGLPVWTAPAVALAGLVALVVAAGIALASIATLVTALLIAHLVLTQLFGVSVALVAPR